MLGRRVARRNRVASGARISNNSSLCLTLFHPVSFEDQTWGLDPQPRRHIVFDFQEWDRTIKNAHCLLLLYPNFPAVTYRQRESDQAATFLHRTSLAREIRGERLALPKGDAPVGRCLDGLLEWAIVGHLLMKVARKTVRVHSYRCTPLRVIEFSREGQGRFISSCCRAAAKLK